MKYNSFSRFSLIFIFLNIFCAHAVIAKPLSFFEAWKFVQKNNDAVLAQKTNLEKANYMHDASLDLSLPRFDLGADYIHLAEPVTLEMTVPIHGIPIPPLTLSQDLTKQNVFTSSIRAIWPIFVGGKISALQDISKAKTLEAKAEVEMKLQAKFEDLTKYYFGVVLAKQVFNTRVEVENGLEKHRDHAKKLEQQGQIAKVEYLQAEASYDKSKVESNKSKRDYEISQAALTRMLKQNEKAAPINPLFTNTSIPNMSEFINGTLDNYPGLKILDSKEKQAQGMIKIQEGKYLPNVILAGSYNIHKDDSMVSEMTPDWAVGVGVSVPLFDNTGRGSKLKAAHSSVLQVNYLKAQAKLDLSLLVEKTYKEAIQSLEEFNGLKSSISLADENLRMRNKAFVQGLATSLDVVDAEMYLASIKTQRFLAEYKYVLSLSRLLTLSGQISTFSNYQAQSLVDNIG